ncbi:hypothetical protein Nepgr_013540 [Nepenthes gracilis]|uniref:Uncharacterized protein n=1 Tax=Nepenthes gracilis TaxID=150966 RepID=A0AAD3XP89_NEPGR|nr:hypothetical protein Nepgr_013540 [Nepenthes gracilis]
MHTNSLSKRRLASSPSKGRAHLSQHRSSKAYAAEYQHTPAEAEINSANIWRSMQNQQFLASGNRPRSIDATPLQQHPESQQKTDPTAVHNSKSVASNATT